MRFSENAERLEKLSCFTSLATGIVYWIGTREALSQVLIVKRLMGFFGLLCNWSAERHVSCCCGGW